MTEELKQKIKDQIKTIPVEAIEALEAVNYLDIVEAVAKEEGLFDEDMDNLAIETCLVLSGAEYFESFATNIEDEVGVSKEQAEKIAQKITERVFDTAGKKLEEILKKKTLGKNLNWKESLKFILSGGNYGVLLQKLGNTVNTEQKTGIKNISVQSIRENSNIKEKFVI